MEWLEEEIDFLNNMVGVVIWAFINKYILGFSSSITKVLDKLKIKYKTLHREGSKSPVILIEGEYVDDKLKDYKMEVYIEPLISAAWTLPLYGDKYISEIEILQAAVQFVRRPKKASKRKNLLFYKREETTAKSLSIIITRDKFFVEILPRNPSIDQNKCLVYHDTVLTCFEEELKYTEKITRWFLPTPIIYYEKNEERHREPITSRQIDCAQIINPDKYKYYPYIITIDELSNLLREH